ncbi:MAG: SH3 domain-containing protein [Acutalibacteraceae bacterium]
MKKTISILLSVVLCFSVFIFSPKVSAAENIYGVGKVTTASTPLNVRSSPSVSASVKTKLARNSYVTLVSKSGSYWKVQYSDTGYGYCHGDYITTVSTNVRTVKTSSGRLRVRSSASATASVKDYLSSGTKVAVISTSNGFS